MRFEISGRPRSSSTSPRTAGVTISRSRLVFEAAR